MRNILLFILFILLFAVCNRRGQQQPPIEEDGITAIPGIKPTVNVYIENSISMNGYIGYDESTKTIVGGNTEFRWAIRDLLVKLKYYYDEPKIFFIANDFTDEQVMNKDVVTFATNIDAYWKKTSIPFSERQNSNLNKVLEKTISELDDTSIAIVISDYLYSIPKKGDAELLLPDQKALTKDAFLSKWKRDKIQLTTTIAKLNSKFTGKYYDKNNLSIYLNGDLRPYYIAVFGGKNAMVDFNRNIKFEIGEIEGFDNKYVLSSGASDNLYYSILLSTYNEGRFKSQRNSGGNNYIHGIEDIQINRRSGKPFAFSVAVDMKNIAAEEDYLLNPDNYLLSDDNFKVKEIVKAEKNNIDPSDWVKINNGSPTHIIVLEATGTALADVSIALKKQMPQWIEKTNIIDDSYIKANLNKTFGIKYLVEGIVEAYEIIYPNDKSYFEIKINIKK